MARGNSLASDTRGEFVEIAACLLLADRNGAASRAQLDTFVRVMGELAPLLPAAMSVPDVGAETDRAETLDRLCADVDVQIGLTVLKGDDAGIPGTKLRGVAEAAGFRLASGGRFEWVQEDTGAVHYTLQNLRNEPFTVDTLRLSATNGVVFVLDVPRVADPPRAFDQMKLAAKRMAHTLGAELVDDNRRPLDDAGAGGDPQAGRRGGRGAARGRHRAGEPAGAGALRRVMGQGVARRPSPAAARQQRAAALTAREIAAHNQRYYEQDAPTVSDAEYDALFRELQALEAQYPELRHARFAHAARRRRAGRRSLRRSRIACRCCRSAPRPNTTVGGRGRVRRAHPARARSSPADAPPVAYMAELKFDGLAMSLRYEQRRARGGRDARRRRDRRGRDRQHPHHSRDPAATRGHARRRCSKCAARCT